MIGYIMLEELLGSRVRARMIAALIVAPGRTLHLRAMTDNVTEIWIALDRLRLPVKIRFTDKKGESFEQVATELGTP